MSTSIYIGKMVAGPKGPFHEARGDLLDRVGGLTVFQLIGEMLQAPHEVSLVDDGIWIHSPSTGCWILFTSDGRFEVGEPAA